MASSNDTPQEPRAPKDGETGGPDPRHDGDAAPGPRDGDQADADTPVTPAAGPWSAREADPVREAELVEGRRDDATDDRPAEDEVAPSAAALAANAGAAAGLAAAAAPSGGSAGDGDAPPRGTGGPRERRRGGGLSMVLGGVIAAGLGAGALWWLDREGIVVLPGADFDGMTAQFERQSERLASLEEGLSQLEGGLASQEERLGSLEAAVEDTTGADALQGLAERTDALAEAVAALDARIDDFDELPLAADPEAREILQAFRDEVTGLRQELQQSSQRAEELMAAVAAEAERADAAEAELDGIAAEAASAEAMGRARSALRLVEAAFANGGNFDASLAVIEDVGVEVPTTLDLMAEDGVPTPAELMDSYPEAARESLQIALRDVEDRTLPERMMAFLRLQFGMRSLAPREGDDVDAILSRAEAALRAGALDEVLAEIATLPAQARAPLEGWAARVETRREAEAALADLSARIDQF